MPTVVVDTCSEHAVEQIVRLGYTLSQINTLPPMRTTTVMFAAETLAAAVRTIQLPAMVHVTVALPTRARRACWRAAWHWLVGAPVAVYVVWMAPS